MSMSATGIVATLSDMKLRSLGAEEGRKSRLYIFGERDLIFKEGFRLVCVC
jgi:hypothetical protein